MKPDIHDVARLFEGRITDPLEERRVIEAIEAAPVLAKLADMFCEAEDFELGELDRGLVARNRQLRQCRLWRLNPAPALAAIVSGSAAEPSLEFERDGDIHRLKLRLAPAGEDRIALEADWPDDMTPLSLVLAQFDLARGRVPAINERLRMPARGVRKASVRPVAGTEALAHTGRVPATAAADSTSPDERVLARSEHFAAIRHPAGGFVIRGRLPAGRDEETVIVESAVPDRDNLRAREPVVLCRVPGQDYGEAILEYLPWPREAPSEVRFVVRPLADEDLPLLTAEHVMALLAVEEFAAVPVEEEGGRVSLRLRYPTQRQMAGDQRTGWFLRVSDGKEGGDE